MIKVNIPTILSSAYSITGETLPDVEIIRYIEQYYGLKDGEIKKRTRIMEVVAPRQLAIWVIANKNMKKNEDDKPEWSKIARRHFPGFTHATLIHSFKEVENKIQTNKYFRKTTEDMLKLIHKKEITVGEVFRKK